MKGNKGRDVNSHAWTYPKRIYSLQAEIRYACTLMHTIKLKMMNVKR